jgi:glucokinase
VVGPGGTLAKRRTRAVDHGRGPGGVVDAIAELVETLVDDAVLGSVGLAVTGPVDRRTGIVANPWTLPGWDRVPIRALVEQRLGVPVAIENDAAAAALGEAQCGAGVGSGCMVMVTVGTGIGVAAVCEGRLWRGAAGRHPEAGHHAITADGPRCSCGVIGCWEHLAAASALERLAREAIEGGRCVGIEPHPTARAIADLAESGHEEARRLIGEVAFHLGRGIRNLEAFYGPDTIVIGGGLGTRFDLLIGPLEQGRSPASDLNPRAEVRQAALGEMGGVVGAGLVAHGTIARAAVETP